MEKIFYGNILVGICIKSFPGVNGTTPITDGKEPLQMLALKYKKGEKIKAHIHFPRERITHRLQECIIVKKGEVKVDLYASGKKYFKSIKLKQGEVFILLHGGCSVNFLKNTEIIEIKNGPFKNDVIFI